jgi:hypothetical protein
MDDSNNKQTSTPPKNEPAVHLRSDTPDTIITPLKVATGEGGAGQSDGRKQSVRYYAAVITALVILVAGGLWLFSYLSRNPIPPDALQKQTHLSGETPQELPSTVPAQNPSPGEQAQHAAQGKEEAEQKLAEFLNIKQELDSKGAAEWGGERYRQVLELSRSADAALMQESFASAAAGYAQASAAALSLQAGIPDVLRDILDQGRRALAEGNGQDAERFFRLALIIEPGHPTAQRDLERAKHCGKVVQLLQSAARQEAENSLSRARADHEEALRLDPASEEARAGLARVSSLIASRQYDELMAGGITALHDRDYQRAQRLLLKARSIKPDSPEVRDALFQAEAALKQIRIDELKARSEGAERAEDWEQALALYQSVLSLDGSIQFALQGKERALKRKTLEEGIQSYLAQPSLLETDQSLSRALALLDEARRVEPRGPRVSRLTTELDALVAAARTTVTVTIESDGITDVAVYKVGRLGRFQSRELSLRPGTYTIIGAREGYKDVRHSLSVRPGSAALRVTVTCSEKI